MYGNSNIKKTKKKVFKYLSYVIFTGNLTAETVAACNFSALRLSSAPLYKTFNHKRKVILCCEENDTARRASPIDLIHLSLYAESH